MIYMAAMALGSQLVLVADRVPHFNAAPSCRSAAAVSVMTGRTTQNCLTDENSAYKALEKSWSKYSATDKAQCDSLERTGGPPSYVELLSCLEMSRDARMTAKADARPGRGSSTPTPATTVGAGAPMKELPFDTEPRLPSAEP